MKRPNLTERLTSNDRAVSPVIGVILMVAITVILAAVIGTFVLDLGQSAGKSAPSASLTVDTSASDDEFTISHGGGDSLQTDSTRIQITNESTDEKMNWEAAGDASFGVGDRATVNTADETIDIGGTEVYQAGNQTGVTDGFEGDGSIEPGHQYTIEIIDTESQRMIFETTVTA